MVLLLQMRIACKMLGRRRLFYFNAELYVMLSNCFQHQQLNIQ